MVANVINRQNYGTWSQSPPKPAQPQPSFASRFRVGQHVSLINGCVLSLGYIQQGRVKQVFPIMPRKDARRMKTPPGWLVVIELKNGSLWFGSEEDLLRDIDKAKLARKKVRTALKVYEAKQRSPKRNPNNAA